MIPSPVVSRPPCANATPVCLRGAMPAGRRRDRGAVLVHVAVAMMGLLAFSALTIDLGTLWVARAQAQNAADAAALSAGVSLAYIDETDMPAARAAAEVVAGTHSVWGDPVVGPALSTAVGACPTGSPAIAGVCANVTVSRRTTTGTALPVFFSRMFGATSNEMWASASAKVMLGNATACVRPLAIVDRWNDLRDTTAPIDAMWTADDTFDAYDAAGNVVPGVNDAYVPPDATSPNSGWALSHVRPSPSLTFRLTDPALPVPLAADQMIAFDLARAGGHPDPIFRYEENLGSCGGTQATLGDLVASIFPHRGHYTTEPLDALVAADNGASWDEGAQVIRGSLFPVSPRLITIAVIDPDDFSRQNRTGGADPTLRVRNLVGFFVEDALESGGEVLVRGRLSRTSGMHDGSAPTLVSEASFLRTVALVR